MLATKLMTRLLVPLTLCVWVGCACAGPPVRKAAETPLTWEGDDFSWVRGANYVPTYAWNDVAIWDRFDAEVIDRELGYAERLGLNSVRVFLQIIVYEKDPELFLERFETFLQLCDKHNIKMMPILFDSCFGGEPTFKARGWVANPGNTRVSQESWPGCEKYIDDVVGRHVGDPRIALWDVMNEPMVAGTFTHTEEGRQKVWRFLRHFIQYVNELDPTHATTVGVASVLCFQAVGEIERVVSIHSYSGNEELHRKTIRDTQEWAEKHGKAALVSEMVHYGLGQTYEMAVRVCREEGIGYYWWEVMIGIDPFPQVTGIFYPDGSIRSTDDVCAVMEIDRREPTKSLFLRRRIGEEEFAYSLAEALSTPTREWNLDRRLSLLHSVTLAETIATLRFKRDNAGMTLAEARRKAYQSDREPLGRYRKLFADAERRFHSGLAAAKQKYNDGDKTGAYEAFDQIVKEVAAELKDLQE